MQKINILYHDFLEKKIMLNDRMMIMSRENNYLLLSDYFGKDENFFMVNQEMDEMAYGKIGRLVQP